MNSEVMVTAADVMRSGIAPHDTSDWVYAVVAIIGAVVGIFTAVSSVRTEKRGQNIKKDADIGQQWQFLTKGMREEIGELRARTDKQDAKIKHLEDSDQKKRQQITALMAHIGRLEQTLSEWREYANRLVAIIVGLGHKAPDPPIDYSDHE